MPSANVWRNHLPLRRSLCLVLRILMIPIWLILGKTRSLRVWQNLDGCSCSTLLSQQMPLRGWYKVLILGFKVLILSLSNHAFTRMVIRTRPSLNWWAPTRGLRKKHHYPASPQTLSSCLILTSPSGWEMLKMNLTWLLPPWLDSRDRWLFLIMVKGGWEFVSSHRIHPHLVTVESKP